MENPVKLDDLGIPLFFDDSRDQPPSWGYPWVSSWIHIRWPKLDLTPTGGRVSPLSFNQGIVDLNGDQTSLLWTSTLASGGVLPPWLHFDTVKHEWWGTAPYEEVGAFGKILGVVGVGCGSHRWGDGEKSGAPTFYIVNKMFGSRWSVGIHELIQLHKGLASFLWQIEWWLGEEFKKLRRLRWNSRRNHRWLFSWWNMVERFKLKAVPTPKHHWILLKSSFLFTSCFNSRSIHDDMMWYGACSSSLVLLFLPTAVFQPGDQARSPRKWLGGKSGKRWPSNKRPTKKYCW